jgi:hypothetical protein
LNIERAWGWMEGGPCWVYCVVHMSDHTPAPAMPPSVAHLVRRASSTATSRDWTVVTAASSWPRRATRTESASGEQQDPSLPAPSPLFPSPLPPFLFPLFCSPPLYPCLSGSSPPPFLSSSRKPIKTIEVPSTAKFLDYSAMAFNGYMGTTVAITSQVIRERERDTRGLRLRTWSYNKHPEHRITQHFTHAGGRCGLARRV